VQSSFPVTVALQLPEKTCPYARVVATAHDATLACYRPGSADTLIVFAQTTSTHGTAAGGAA
jgi:hypothetical protein